MNTAPNPDLTSTIHLTSLRSVAEPVHSLLQQAGPEVLSVLKELGVVESKRGAIRKGLVHELLYAQDTVLCSYFAQREGAIKGDEGRRNTAAEVFQGLDRFG